MLLQMALFHSFFNGWVIFHCIHMPYFLYLFICWWTFWLLLCLGYCKLCCYEHYCACIFLNYVFCEHIPSTETAGSYGNSIFSFLRNLNIVLHNGCATLNSHQPCRRVLFSTPSSAFLFLDFDDGLSDWCEVIHHCIFLMISDVEHLYMYFWAICLFWRSSSGSSHFFEWVVILVSSCMNCLYILVINTLLVALLANIFSHSVGRLFVLFMFSFAVQKLLSLIKSCLFIFVFIFITLEGGSKKDIAVIYVWVLPMFSLKSFRSLVHF